MAFSNLKALAYNIHKITGDTIIQEIEIPEIPKCSICTKDILVVGLQYSNVDIYFTDVDVVDEGSRRDSASSQTSGTSTLVNEFTCNIEINFSGTTSQGQAMDLDKNEETEHQHGPAEG
ncbi:11013_t:CDS:2 [Ambispora leptoticha]|uniref:11013_t:CDS:1 n=1 Tax=Ambispora leptoticha TaxID=144679 RepID=A0A9N8WFX5_9GLOM|nr:11013_t:CDS:2 [Ambispora leptoticha]